MSRPIDGDSELSLPVWAFITIGLMLLLTGALIALTSAVTIARVVPVRVVPAPVERQILAAPACDRKHSTDCY